MGNMCGESQDAVNKKKMMAAGPVVLATGAGLTDIVDKNAMLYDIEVYAGLSDQAVYHKVVADWNV